VSDQSTRDNVEPSPTCQWCGASFQPDDATYGVHIVGLDSTRLTCPHQDLRRIAEAQREAAYGGVMFYLGAGVR
jgi:hypothetical protein